MMRKTSLIFLGALVGVVATLLLTQPHTLLMGSAAGAAASDTYRTLSSKRGASPSSTGRASPLLTAANKAATLRRTIA